MSFYFPNVDAIFLFKRAGTPEDPFLPLQQDLQVKFSKVTLKEIPDFTTKVSVKNTDNVNLTEITNPEPQINEYRVDYSTGIVYFNISQEDETLTFAYTGIGQLDIPASRMIVNTSNDNAERITVQDIIDANTEVNNVKALVEQNQVVKKNDYNVDMNNVTAQLATNALLVSNGLNTLTSSLTNAKAYNQIYITENYTLEDGVTITKDLYIRSNMATIFGNGKEINVRNTPGIIITFENIIFDAVLFKIQNYKHVKFINCKAINCPGNFVADYGGDTVEFENCEADSLGTTITDTESANSNVINRGKMYYSVGGTQGGETNLLIIKNHKGKNGKGFGSAGYYLQKVKRIECDGIIFENCRHSPIYFYSAIPVEGFVKNGSAKNANAIVYSANDYTDGVEVTTLYVEDSISNAVEGTFKRIYDIYALRPGWGAGSKYGAVPEGIWLGNTKSVGKITVIESKGSGIKTIKSSTIEDLSIEDCLFVDIGEEAILLQSTDAVDAFKNISIDKITVKGTGKVNTASKRNFTLTGTNTTELKNGVKFGNNIFETPNEGGSFLGVSFKKDRLITKSPTFANSPIGSTPTDWAISNGTAIIKQKDTNLKYVELKSNGSGIGCNLSQTIDTEFSVARVTIELVYRCSDKVGFHFDRYDVNGTLVSSSSFTKVLPVSTDFKKVVVGIPACVGGKIRFSVRSQNQTSGAICDVAEFSVYTQVD
ncbi:hypothetical protein AB1L07_01770 [Niallia alba]|uniref:hypothetical protein n=1 Tax=Niallia alba TaxID=2729105 RepID=UPI0039A1FAEB